jgi:hypothetical protein
MLLWYTQKHEQEALARSEDIILIAGQTKGDDVFCIERTIFQNI